MADILISKFTTQIPRVGATPATPGFAESEGQDPVAPSGSPLVYTPVTIGSPANGLSISGTQVLTIGLASTSTTGALSSTDWNTFNGKIGGTIASGQVAFGTGVNTVGGDSGLTWNNTTKILTLNNTTGGIIYLRDTDAVSGFNTNYVQQLNNAFQIGTRSSTGVFVDTFYQVLLNATGATTHQFLTQGVERIRITSTGLVGIGNITPTNTLDVNGTARIRTISNLGVSATNVLVPDATGVVSLRTASQFLADAGGISGTIASGQVAFGTGVNTVGGDASFLWDNSLKTLNFTNTTRIDTTGANTELYLKPSANSATNSLRLSELLRVYSAANTAILHHNANNQQVVISGGNASNQGGNILFYGATGSNRIDFRIGSTEVMRMISNGLGILTSGNPTNTLDVNGTARIRTISNLGSAATSVLVPSATGVLSLRTLAELASDGLGSKWTDVTGGIFRNGAVAIGRTTIPTNATFAVQSLTATGSHQFFQLLNNVGSVLASLTQNGDLGINTASSSDIKFSVRAPSDTSTGAAIRAFNLSNTLTFELTGATLRSLVRTGINRSEVDVSLGVQPLSGETIAIRVYTNAGARTVDIVGSTGNYQSVGGAFFGISNTTAPTGRVDIRGIGTTTNSTLLLEDSAGTDNAIFLDNGRVQLLRLPTSATGLGVGDLWNDNGNVRIGTTVTFRDQESVKTTASADQTLPSGTLTILDYDSTLLNNSTATYTVGTDGRITINTTGIYTITAGVVIEADAVTALESAFLGIFRNGDLVSISSINTTIAAGAQSGLSTSTILSLTATDIIDCRALVNSVGGVANGLARRLGTLLGANATQVNSLSITKNSM